MNIKIKLIYLIMSNNSDALFKVRNYHIWNVWIDFNYREIFCYNLSRKQTVKKLLKELWQNEKSI